MYVYRDWALMVDANALHMHFISQDDVCIYRETGL